MVLVKFKKMHPDAVIPKYANSGDAGLDATATSKSYDEYGNVVYGTGLAMEIPENYVCLIFPRSSNSKKDLILSNCVGILDSTYRGELSFKFKPSPKFSTEENWGERTVYHKEEFVELYQIGDRIGQLLILPYPTIEPVEVDELSESVRGANGWGSTGN